MNVDQWRRNEAEARQEIGVLVCSCCGNKVDECDTFTCGECGEVFCHYCILDRETPLCGPCLEKQEAFDEVETVEKLDPEQAREIKAKVDGVMAASKSRIKALLYKLDTWGGHF